MINNQKKELWELCKAHTRKKYGTACFTCGTICGVLHTGHFIPSSVCGALLRYHPHNLATQCEHCNIALSGNVNIYEKRLREKIGDKKVDALFRLKHKSVKADSIFLQTLIDIYKKGDEEKIVAFLEK